MAISDVGFVDPSIIDRMCFCFSQRFATYFHKVLLRASQSTFSKSCCMHTQVLHMSFSSPCCVPRKNQRLLQLCSHSVEQGSVVGETKGEDGLLMLLTTLAIMDASETTSRTDQLINFLGQAGRQAVGVGCFFSFLGEGIWITTSIRSCTGVAVACQIEASASFIT